VIERAYSDSDGDITIVCDECGEGYESNTADFYAAIRDFKQQGGRVRPHKGGWEHTCADCASSEDEGMFS